MIPGCQKLVRKNNRCTKHGTAASNAPAPSSQPQLLSVFAATKATKTTAAVAATAAVLTASVTEAPVAPAPISRRRHAALSRPKTQGSSPLLAEPPRPSLSPPEQPGGETRGTLGWPPSSRRASRVGQDQTPSLSPNLLAGKEDDGHGFAGGGSLPPVSAMARGPPLTFGCSDDAGPPLGSFSPHRPPVAPAFDSSVAMGGGSSMPGGSTVGELSDRVALDANGGVHYPRSFRPCVRFPLPDVKHIGSPSLSLASQSGNREAPSSTGQPASGSGSLQSLQDSSAAAQLLSLAESLPRDLLPGRNTAATAAAGGGRIDIIDDLASRPLEYAAFGPPSSAQAPRGDRSPLYLSTRHSGGWMERRRSLSPVPPSLLLQQPPPFAVPHFSSATAATASTSSCDSSGGRRMLDWSDVGGRPVLSCDGRGGIPTNRPPNVSAWFQGAHPSAPDVGVAPPSSPAAFVGDNPGGEASVSRNTVDMVSPPMSGSGPCVPSEPVAATAAASATTRSLEMVRPTSATAPQQRTSCCGGSDKPSGSGGGSKASSPGSTVPLQPAAASAAEVDVGGGSGKSRSCSTSPPLEQTASFISLSVTGMMCMENCGQTVQRALREVPGVRSVTIHFPTRTASVHVSRIRISSFYFYATFYNSNVRYGMYVCTKCCRDASTSVGGSRTFPT